MVLDFGFLKEEMTTLIAAPCDHGFIIALADTEFLDALAPLDEAPEGWRRRLAVVVREQGYCATFEGRLDTRLYVVPFQPTAERLARHWFERLAPLVRARSEDLAVLTSVTVWETPNSRADYVG